MGLFEKKQSLSRKELRQALRKDTGRVPETFSGRYDRHKRVEIEKEVFGSKFGSSISKSDYKWAVRDLRRAERKAATPKEKKDLYHKRRYIERLGGI